MDHTFGIRLGSILYILVQTTGQIIFTMGALVNLYWVMIVGKFVYGIGDEAMLIPLNTYPVLWFKAEKLNMIYGLQIATSRIYSTFSYWTIEPLYNETSKHFSQESSLGMTLVIGSLACIFSTICVVAVVLIDKRAEKILERKIQNQNDVDFTDIKSFDSCYWVHCSVCLFFYMAFSPFMSLSK